MEERKVKKVVIDASTFCEMRDLLNGFDETFRNNYVEGDEFDDEINSRLDKLMNKKDYQSPKIVIETEEEK